MQMLLHKKPCILAIEDFDNICVKKEEQSKEMLARISSALKFGFDELKYE